MIEAELLKALSNPQEFQKIIGMHSFLPAIQLFPQHADALFNFIVEHPIELNRVISNIFVTQAQMKYPREASSFINFVITHSSGMGQLTANSSIFLQTVGLFPQHADKLLTCIIEDPAKHAWIFHYTLRLENMLDMSPQHFAQHNINAFIILILENPVTERSISPIGSHVTWIQLAHRYPQYTEALITPILKDIKKFRHFISSDAELLAAIAAFPQYVDSLIKIVLENKMIFIQLIGNAWKLHNIAAALPHYAQTLYANALEQNYENIYSEVIKLLPREAEAIAELIIQDPKEFERRIKTNSDLNAISAFPQYASIVIPSVLESRQKFKRLIPDADGLASTAAAFPQYTKALYKRALDHRYPGIFSEVVGLLPEEAEALIVSALESARLEYFFVQFIRDYHVLHNVIRSMPQFLDPFIGFILKQRGMFQLVIRNCENLLEIINDVPQHASTLLKVGLENYEEFKRLISTDEELLKIVKILTRQDEGLIKAVLENAIKSRLIRNYITLFELGRCIPGVANTFIESVLKNSLLFQRIIPNNKKLVEALRAYPDYAEMLTVHILKSSIEFMRLITSITELVDIAAILPEYAGSLIKLVLGSPVEFKRFIRNIADLHKAAAAFPQHVAFSKSTVAEAITYLKNEAEIRKNARVLAQINRSGLFAQLPTEILANIAGRTGNAKICDKKSSEDIVLANLGRPS